jgi:Uma2 family endonuclease
MGTAQTTPVYTSEQYLATELLQAERSIFIRGQVYAMAGGTAGHNNACLNAAFALRTHLAGSGCRVFMESLRLHIATADCYYYPDVMVSCHNNEASDPSIHTLEHAKLVIEVLSPSTAAFDRGDKFADYRQLASLEEYVLVDLDATTIDTYRKGADGLWVLHPSNAQAPQLHFASVGWRGDMRDVFA